MRTGREVIPTARSLVACRGTTPSAPDTTLVSNRAAALEGLEEGEPNADMIKPPAMVMPETATVPGMAVSPNPFAL